MSSASLSGVSSPPTSSPNQSRSAGVAQSGSKAPLPPVPSRVAAPVRRTSGVLLQSPGVPQQGGSGGGGNNVQVICRFRPTREQESVKWFELLDDQVSITHLPVLYLNAWLDLKDTSALLVLMFWALLSQGLRTAVN